MKLCKDCKWFRPGGVQESRCAHEKSFVKVDPVTGNHWYRSARSMRDSLRHCWDGELWEQVPPSQWIWIVKQIMRGFVDAIRLIANPWKSP